MAVFDPRLVALAKGMVYLHFGFRIPEGADITSQTGTPVGAAHVAGNLNQIGTNWVPVASNGQIVFTPLLKTANVQGVTPAGELMRLCYVHLKALQTAAIAAKSVPFDAWMKMHAEAGSDAPIHEDFARASVDDLGGDAGELVRAVTTRAGER
jgi:hypothetical protein